MTFLLQLSLAFATSGEGFCYMHGNRAATRDGDYLFFATTFGVFLLLPAMYFATSIQCRFTGGRWPCNPCNEHGRRAAATVYRGARSMERAVRHQLCPILQRRYNMNVSHGEPSVAQMVRFVIVEPTHQASSLRLLQMCLHFQHTR